MGLRTFTLDMFNLVKRTIAAIVSEKKTLMSQHSCFYFVLEKFAVLILTEA